MSSTVKSKVNKGSQKEEEKEGVEQFLTSVVLLYEVVDTSDPRLLRPLSKQHERLTSYVGLNFRSHSEPPPRTEVFF